MVFRFRKLSQWIWSIGIVSMFTLVLILQQPHPDQEDDVIINAHQRRHQQQHYEFPSMPVAYNGSAAKEALDSLKSKLKLTPSNNRDISIQTQNSVGETAVKIGESVLQLSHDEQAVLNRTKDPEIAAAIKLFYHYKHENDHMIAMIPEDQRVAPTACPPKLTEIASRGGLPRTGLLSFPGSGNTWVRHLIQMATGMFCLFVWVKFYVPSARLFQYGLYKTCVPNQCIPVLLKLHHQMSQISPRALALPSIKLAHLAILLILQLMHTVGSVHQLKNK